MHASNRQSTPAGPEAANPEIADTGPRRQQDAYEIWATVPRGRKTAYALPWDDRLSMRAMPTSRSCGLRRGYRRRLTICGRPAWSNREPFRYKITER